MNFRMLVKGCSMETDNTFSNQNFVSQINDMLKVTTCNSEEAIFEAVIL